MTLCRTWARELTLSALVAYLQAFDEDTPTGWWPTNDAFRRHLLEQPLYGALTQARVQMLLKAAEARLHTTKTETVGLPGKLTVEHIIPQTWKDTWPLTDPEDDDAIARRRQSIHQLGNLTLVTGSLNPSLGNDPWASKRVELAKHSALRLNALLVHDHPGHFDEAAVDARSAALAELLVAEWPGPDAVEWS